MKYRVEYDLVLHIRGELNDLDYKPRRPIELLEDIFPGDCDCEFLDVSTSMNSGHQGYMNVVAEGDDEDD